MIKDKVIWCNRGWMPYHFGFCPSEKAWQREMERLAIKPSPPYPTNDASCTYFQNTGIHKACALVTMSDTKRTGIAKVGMLVHEAMHVWRAMKEDIGETAPSAEFEAYSMQAIAQELIEAFETTRGKLCYRRVS